MIDTASLLDNLSVSDPVARQEAKQTIEAHLAEAGSRAIKSIELARLVENERQARTLSGIIGRAVNEFDVAVLIAMTSAEQGWVSSVVRRAIRTWLETASPQDAAAGLRACLIVAADKNDSRTDEFVCTATVETVSREADVAYRALVPVLEGIIAQRGGLRRNLTWLMGTPPPPAFNPFELTLSTLEGLLPEGNLPLPAQSAPDHQNLPRPASEYGDEDTDQLPLPVQSTSPTPPRPLSLWERLFGKRAP